MSMPTSIEFNQGMNVIGVWFFWFCIYVIITLGIGILLYATTLYLSKSEHKSIKINRTMGGSSYGKSRKINKRVA